MSEFASTHTAIDMKEQTRATVEAAAKLEGQLIFEQSELDSLEAGLRRRKCSRTFGPCTRG